jgi:hypothetical protein
LRADGIQPDILVCRTEVPLDNSLKGKISLFCNVDQDAVITAIDVATIYLLSTENLGRDADELGELLQIIADVVDEITRPERNWEVRIVGRLELLPEWLADRLRHAEQVSTGRPGVKVNVAVGYGGRQEIADAIYAFPTLLLAIVVAIAISRGQSDLRSGIIAAAASITVVFIPQYFRVVRAEVVRVKSEAFVESAKVIGAAIDRRRANQTRTAMATAAPAKAVVTAAIAPFSPPLTPATAARTAITRATTKATIMISTCSTSRSRVSHISREPRRR